METEDIPPATLKPAPLTVAWEIMTVAEPVFVRVNVCELLDPVTTLPKLKLVALAVSRLGGEPFEPGFACVPVPVNPTQPESVNITITATNIVTSAKSVRPFVIT
jgi:hypothetical protein